jgi:hypothetical protein
MGDARPLLQQQSFFAGGEEFSQVAQSGDVGQAGSERRSVVSLASSPPRPGTHVPVAIKELKIPVPARAQRTVMKTSSSTAAMSRKPPDVCSHAEC